MNDDRDLCPACLAVHNYLHLGDNKVPTRTHDQGAEYELVWAEVPNFMNESPAVRHQLQIRSKSGAHVIPICFMGSEINEDNLGAFVRQYNALSAQPPAPSYVEYRMSACHAGSDGDCSWEQCPQLRDGEPVATGRSCPLGKQPPAPSGEAQS